MTEQPRPGSPVTLLALVSLAACIGWGMVWKKSQEVAALQQSLQTSEQEANRQIIEPVTLAPKPVENRTGPMARSIQDPRSAKLFRDLAAIAAFANNQPGVINDRLISACRETLMDTDPIRRNRDFAVLLEQMRPEDAATIHQCFVELQEEGRSFSEYESFASRWGEVDGQGALDYLMAQVPRVVNGSNFRDVARGWGHVKPMAALAWMAAHEKESLEMGGRAAVVDGWMQTDVAAATHWVLNQKLDQQEASNCITSGMIAQLHNHGLEVASRWLADLPDDGVMAEAASMAWKHCEPDFRQLPYETAARMFGLVCEQPWMTVTKFTRLTTAVSSSRTAVEGLAGFLKELEKTWPPEKVSARFKSWAAANRSATVSWINNAPRSPIRDAAILGLSAELKETDPVAAAMWREQIGK